MNWNAASRSFPTLDAGTSFEVVQTARDPRAADFSFVPKRYHRIEARGFVGGPNAEEQADTDRDEDAENRRP